VADGLPAARGRDNHRPGGRRGVPGLETPHPISSLLPGLYQEDDFARRLTSALDDVLAPVFCALDNLEAYFDPELAPMDFVEWLAGWMALVLDESWPPERKRAFLGQAAELYRWRGTVRGLAGVIAIHTGVQPEIVDSGGTEWSPVPSRGLPPRRGHHVTVRLTVPRGSTIDVNRLDRIVAATKPAHVAHKIELVRS
jgi:phage tail-like protein